MIKRLTFLLLIASCWSAVSLAAIQEHTFTISGDNGETGTGSFTWDDAVVSDGSELAGDSFSLPPELLSIDITISGGNVAGGSTTFTRSDCLGAILENTPDFVIDINFWCNNGTNTLDGVEVYTNELNDAASVLTFTPASTSPIMTAPSKVPTLSFWALALLTGLLGLVAARNLALRAR